MRSSYSANTLRYDASRCRGCSMCWTVCPHAVFESGDGAARLVEPTRCIECGACSLNCPENAIAVDSGVGCASALMLAALTGREPTCGCDEDGHGGCCT
ncbi:MAG: mercury methylation ferredoxin HgcB [Candidatus Eisenbacteria bacterium]